MNLFGIRICVTFSFIFHLWRSMKNTVNKTRWYSNFQITPFISMPPKLSSNMKELVIKKCKKKCKKHCSSCLLIQVGSNKLVFILYFFYLFAIHTRKKMSPLIILTWLYPSFVSLAPFIEVVFRKDPFIEGHFLEQCVREIRCS